MDTIELQQLYTAANRLQDEFKQQAAGFQALQDAVTEGSVQVRDDPYFQQLTQDSVVSKQRIEEMQKIKEAAKAQLTTIK